MNNTIKVMMDIIGDLNRFNDAYYNHSQSLVSDHEYDMLYDELVELEKKTGIVLSNSPTRKVGYEVKSELRKVEHNHPMLSLNKTKSISELNKFRNGKDCVLMLKMDGLTCSLKYLDGKLVSAETRGNGMIGEDILHNAKVCKNIPLELPDIKGELIVDGEIIIDKTTFNKINEKLPENEKYANPRNLASGSIRQLDSAIAAGRGISFVAWKCVKGLERIKTFHGRLSNLSAWFDVVPYRYIYDFNRISDLEDEIEHLKEDAGHFDYPIDGMVLSYNDIEYGESLGATDKYVRSQLAYKFYDEEYETIIVDVEWTMGKSGQLTPTAVFAEVEIDGTMVGRASLHNVSIFNKYNLHKCDKINVYKANMIIPQISENLTDEDGFHVGDKFTPPDVCPYCGEKTTVVRENHTDTLMCFNARCKGKLLGELCAFVSKKAHDIVGVSESTLSLLIESGMINSPIDLYHLEDSRDKLSTFPGMGAKKVDKILEAIEKSRRTTLQKFLVGLNIPLIGSRAAKDIEKFEINWCKENGFDNPMDAFIADVNDYFSFSFIDGIGKERNASLRRYFTENMDSYVMPLMKEFTFESLAPSDNKVQILDGKKVCITGKLKAFENRDAFIKDIESYGGKVVSSVTKQTDFLINNDSNSSSSKNKKAKELGIPIISEFDYMQFVL